MRVPCKILSLGDFNSVVEFDGKPFFFDDFVIGAAVENVCIAVNFIAFAHGNFAGEFFGKEFANVADICFGDALALGNAAEAHADAVAEFAERKLVAFVRKFGIYANCKRICIAENRTYDTVFVIHCGKDR